MAIADFGGRMQAVKAALRQRAMEEQALAHRQAIAEQEMGLRARNLEQDADQFRERMDFDRDLANRPAPEPAPMEIGGRLVTRTGQVVYEPPPEPDKPINLGPGAVLADKTGRIILRNQQAQAAPAQEPLVPVIGDDGRPVLMPRSQAAGRAPASTREQTGNRPIISGDANRIADYDTSLDDLDVLAEELGQTGAQSQLGAMAPNFVTEFTGFGEDAKARQAMIDRVKQVIGKALEGGVLRKEDEVKYAKILPVIGDDPQVAQSKLKGLGDAITQRRGTLIDSLTDAGYDTSKFRERQRTPKTKSGGAVAMVAPDGRALNVPADKVAELEAKGAKRR